MSKEKENLKKAINQAKANVELEGNRINQRFINTYYKKRLKDRSYIKMNQRRFNNGK